LEASPGGIHLLEWLTELRELLTCIYLFILKYITQSTDEEPDKEVDGCGASALPEPLWFRYQKPI
jgi:hypothetical protein